MSPFWPTIRPFLITIEGDGRRFIAAANFVGSIPTSCGVAVCQLDPGKLDAVICGVRIGGGCGDVLAPAGEPISPASDRSVTINIVARILGESFLVCLIVRALRRVFISKIFS